MFPPTNNQENKYEPVTFGRECDAIMIPDGFPIVVPEGTLGAIMQVLGGTYTIRLDSGFLVRVEAIDGDAIGKESVPTPALNVPNGEVTKAVVMEALSSCYDPEIPVNIVDLGLVYDVEVSDDELGGKRVEVTMTLTAPGCGMGQVLQDDVRRYVGRIPNVKRTYVTLVFDPPWSVERMTESARLELGFD